MPHVRGIYVPVGGELQDRCVTKSQFHVEARKHAFGLIQLHEQINERSYRRTQRKPIAVLSVGPIQMKHLMTQLLKSRHGNGTISSSKTA